jgi:gliding motility-associated-like protein
LLLCNCIYAQIDTLFWFAVPEVVEGGYGFDRPIKLEIVSYEEATQVVIDIPANSSINAITRNVAPNSLVSINLTSLIDELECRPPNQILNKGLRVRATKRISAFYVLTGSSHSFCNECNAEIFTLKGKKALGTKFYIPFQNNYPNIYPNAISSFDIIATENNTSIEIRPTQNIVGTNANNLKKIILNKGQTYTAQSSSQNQNSRPVGSKIVSDKPIAITIKDDMVSISSCQDIAGDQLFPVSSTGQEYVAIKGYLNSADLLTIVATENNTEVRFNNSPAIVLNEGQSHIFSLSSNVVFIKSNKKVYVSQLSGIGCEASFAILPPADFSCNNNFNFVRPSTDNFYLFIIVAANAITNFSINGNNSPFQVSDFLDVPNTGGMLKYLRKQIPIGLIPSNVNCSIRNSETPFMFGFINGRSAAGGTRFGYFSDFSRFEKTQALADKTVLCEGENLGLIGNTTLVQGAFWTGPNGFYSTQLNPVINQITLAQQGYYVLHAPGSECASGIDSVLITIKTALPKPILSSNGPVCPFERLALYVNNKPTYPHAIEWYDSKGNVIGNGDSLVFNPVRELDGNRFSARYIPIGDSYCLGDTALLLHTIKNFPTKPRLEGSKEFCENDTIKLTNYSEHDQDVLYLWTGPNGLSSSQLRYWILPNAQQPFHNGLYTLQLSYSNGCKSELDTTSVLVVAYPKLNLVETTQNSPICEGDMLLISANSSESDLNYRWKSPDLNFFLTQVVERENSNLTMEGLYSLSVGRKNCIYFDTLHVQTIIYPHAKADFAYTPLPASRSETVFFNNRSTNALTYSWDFTDGFHSSEINPSHIFVEEKRFWVKLIAYSPDSLCPDTVVKSVDVFNKEVGVYVPTAFSPNRDQVNDRFRVEASGVSFEIQMDIYNRWGEMIFTTPDARNVAWDGTFMGKECPPGVYLYIIQYIDKFGNPKASKGTISIIR